MHISDIHLTENGTVIWGVNTLEHFQKAIQKIKGLDGIDGILVSGDLSNDGSLWTYKYIDRTFEETGVPTYCCPGNHDNLEMFYHGYKPSYYKICEKFCKSAVTQAKKRLGWQTKKALFCKSAFCIDVSWMP